MRVQHTAFIFEVSHVACKFILLTGIRTMESSIYKLGLFRRQIIQFWNKDFYNAINTKVINNRHIARVLSSNFQGRQPIYNKLQTTDSPLEGSTYIVCVFLTVFSLKNSSPQK